MPFSDPLAAEREALAKAEADVTHLAEAKRRAAAAAEYELVAPLAERRGPLPERLPTLRYLPVEDQPLYAQDSDGTFVLAYVRITDEASALHYAERIGRGISVLGDGETPASRLAQQQLQREREAKVNLILESTALAAAEAKLSEAEARHRDELARIDAERERIRRTMGPGGITRVSF